MARLIIILMLMGLAPPVAAQICDTRFRLTNLSGRTVVEVNFDPARDDLGSWREDRLDGRVLHDEAWRNFAPAVGGRYDFRVVFADGETAERRSVDVCRIGRVTILDGRIVAE